MGVVLSINDRRKRVSGRGLCEPFTKKISHPGECLVAEHRDELAPKPIVKGVTSALLQHQHQVSTCPHGTTRRAVRPHSRGVWWPNLG